MHGAQRLVKNRVAIDCLAQPLATVFGHRVVEPSPAAYLKTGLHSDAATVRMDNLAPLTLDDVDN